MQQNNKNILLATVLSAAILLSWTWFYEKPRIERQEVQRKILAQTKSEASGVKNPSNKSSITIVKTSSDTLLTLKNRDEILNHSKSSRIEIESESLHGSISLKGARFDDLTLAKYFETTKHEKEVIVFAPEDSKERYFADFGWISSRSDLEMPNPNTIWKSNSTKLTPENPVILTWKNKHNIEFSIKISVDKNYMFDITQSVVNHSKEEISVAAYGRINRALNNLKQSNYILHEGAIGVFDQTLKESSYKDLIEEKK